MPIDFAKWRKQREQSRAADNRGGDFYSFPEGTTIVYVAPGPDELGIPYLELDVHRNVGGKMVLCFDPGSPGLWEEGMAAARAEKGVEATYADESGNDVPLLCDVCDYLASGEATLAQMDTFGMEGMGRSRIRLAVVVPIGKVGRDSSGSLRREPFADGAQNPAICFFPKTVYDALCDALDLNGDITDPDQARYLLVTKIKKKGKGGRPRTEYDVVVDPETVRNPVRLSKSLRAKLRDQCAPGKGCNLFRVANNFLKSPDDVYNMLYGAAPAAPEPEQPADGPTRKACFGSAEYDASDDECQHCDDVAECAAIAAPDQQTQPPAPAPQPTPAPTAPARVTSTGRAAGKPTVVRGKRHAPAPEPVAPEPAGVPGFDDDDIPDHQPPEEPSEPETPSEPPPAAEPKKAASPPTTARKSVSAEEFNRQIAARAAARAKRGQ